MGKMKELFLEEQEKNPQETIDLDYWYELWLKDHPEEQKKMLQE